MATTIKNGNPPDAVAFMQGSGRLASFDANRILKSDTSVFINSQYSGADDFTDSNGVMNTVDTSASTAIYDTDNEQYIIGFTDEASGDTTHNPDSVTNPSNAFDGSDSTFADKSIGTGEASLGKTFSSKRVSVLHFKSFMDVSEGAAASGNMSFIIETFNGSTWDNVTTFNTAYSWGGGGGSANKTEERDIIINGDHQGVRIRLDNTGSAVTSNARWYLIQYGDYDSTSTVDTNTIINIGVPKSIVVFAERTEPTNTSITVDVSDDGGSTFGVTGGSFDSYIDTTALSGSDLALRFNLNTTDTNITPFLKSYGVAITDS